MTELLPCPFCGKPPLVDDDGDGVCSLSCGNDDCIGVEVTCPTFDDAAGFWNTRTPAPDVAATPTRKETDDELAEQIHKVAGCQIGSERTRKLIAWYRGKHPAAAPQAQEDGK